MAATTQRRPAGSARAGRAARDPKRGLVSRCVRRDRNMLAGRLPNRWPTIPEPSPPHPAQQPPLIATPRLRPVGIDLVRPILHVPRAQQPNIHHTRRLIHPHRELRDSTKHPPRHRHITRTCRRYPTAHHRQNLQLELPVVGIRVPHRRAPHRDLPPPLPRLMSCARGFSTLPGGPARLSAGSPCSTIRLPYAAFACQRVQSGFRPAGSTAHTRPLRCIP